MSSIQITNPGVRLAVEGCGHGTLNAIYASIKESCRVKGWDGVDMLIIGGDFQAVRNHHDLNVTSMPQKYRKMADFHEYYSGARKAPYLTIFIGGNHEASNHLFELYYGGWVAPNIYYLGAANLLRFGPIRIAGLSGIWKGYDYRKPHFERLPYNSEEMSSIYHVREIDMRKLLSIRSQVDIGLSHDWPQGVELLGDYEWLFRNKRGFKDDSDRGQLGSVAARQCLDRLRPPHWFSAHLHTKYVAIVQHGEYKPIQHGGTRATTKLVPDQEPKRSTPNSTPTDNCQRNDAVSKDNPKISAWQNFHAVARQTDAEDRDNHAKELQQMREEEARTGVRSKPQYVFNETFKKVETNDSCGRNITSVEQHDAGKENFPIANLDGCAQSRPISSKRKLENPDEIDVGDDSEDDLPQSRPVKSMQKNLDGSSSFHGSEIVSSTNPEAIEIDISEEEEDVPEPDSYLALNPEDPKERHVEHDKSKATSPTSETSEEGGVELNRVSNSRTNMASISSVMEQSEPLDSIKKLDGSSSNESAEAECSVENSKDTTQKAEEDIPEEIRAQLAELSTSFAPAPEKVEMTPNLPLPETITNRTTEFLALGKCEPYQEFLQLLEIRPLSSDDSDSSPQRPLKLTYDPEWLAILRVFAPELSLGGQPEHGVPPHRGETYYRDRIIEEEKWIDEHVTQKSLLDVPNNFSITATVYDPRLLVKPSDMPREVSNPQTSRFCDLIGIENLFDVSEEVREERIRKGPRLERESFRGGGRGGGRGGRGGGGGGRGGRQHNHGGQGGGRRGGFGGGRGGRGGGRGGRGWH